MKNKKKILAATLSGTIQDKLRESSGQAEKIKKAIKKMAKGLAERIIKVVVQEDKKLKKTKKVPVSVITDVEKKGGKQKKATRLTKLEELVTSERALLSKEKSKKDTGE